MFIEMNDILVNNVVVIPLIHRAEVVGVTNNLQGVNLTPWDMSTWNIVEWQKTN
jgi:peptide/nickel transport system substrate-binding protein